MGVCDDILKKDIVPSCDDPVVQGLEQEGGNNESCGCGLCSHSIQFYKKECD